MPISLLGGDSGRQRIDIPFRLCSDVRRRRPGRNLLLTGISTQPSKEMDLAHANHDLPSANETPVDAFVNGRGKRPLFDEAGPVTVGLVDVDGVPNGPTKGILCNPRCALTNAHLRIISPPEARTGRPHPVASDALGVADWPPRQAAR